MQMEGLFTHIFALIVGTDRQLLRKQSSRR